MKNKFTSELIWKLKSFSHTLRKFPENILMLVTMMKTFGNALLVYGILR
jgi:hypothetical protein